MQRKTIYNTVHSKTIKSVKDEIISTLRDAGLLTEANESQILEMDNYRSVIVFKSILTSLNKAQDSLTLDKINFICNEARKSKVPGNEKWYCLEEVEEVLDLLAFYYKNTDDLKAKYNSIFAFYSCCNYNEAVRLSRVITYLAENDIPFNLDEILLKKDYLEQISGLMYRVSQLKNKKEYFIKILNVPVQHLETIEKILQNQIEQRMNLPEFLMRYTCTEEDVPILDQAIERVPRLAPMLIPGFTRLIDDVMQPMTAYRNRSFQFFTRSVEADKLFPGNKMRNTLLQILLSSSISSEQQSFHKNMTKLCEDLEFIKARYNPDKTKAYNLDMYVRRFSLGFASIGKKPNATCYKIVNAVSQNIAELDVNFHPESVLQNAGLSQNESKRSIS